MNNTLREPADEAAALARLEQLGTARNTTAVAERAELLRVLGRLDEALAMAEESYRLAFFTGDREFVVSTRLSRARVLHDRGTLARALTEVSACRQSARTEGWGELEATSLYQQASILVDLTRYAEAQTALTDLIELKTAQRAPHEQLTALSAALEMVMRRILVEPSPEASASQGDPGAV